MKILAIRIGDKYGPEYETYLERKLPNHEFIWVREPYDTGVVLQWNKMWGMQMDIDEPICVIDIDILLVNNYEKVFDYPVMSDPNHWQHYYIKNGTTKGPVNGEQYFVEDSVKEKLELITLPKAWFTRWVTDESINYGKNMTKWQIELTNKYNDITGNDYIYLGGEFHEDIKFVHFTHSLNKPHLWEDYSIHV